MSEVLPTNRSKPWHHVGYRILGDMFTANALRWCTVCRSDTEHKQEFRYEGNVYGKKEWCAACGSVINWGVFGGDEAAESILVHARQWAQRPEQDRR